MRVYIAIISAILTLLLQTTGAKAQYFSLGDDPGGVKWKTAVTENYDILYPHGCDSLAKVYARELERFRDIVHKDPGRHSGRMPVILHPYMVTSNGMVMWAPSRMELLTTPSAYEPDILPWETQLAVHETRHIAHINNFRNGIFRPLEWLFGQQAAGAMFGLFQNTYMYEGDAVTAETAFTDGGRGRNADFVSYMMAAFDNGDFRNRDRWICGSYRHYTPDNYVYGYMFNSSNILGSGNFAYYSEVLGVIRRKAYIPWIGNLAYRTVLGKTKRELHDEMTERFKVMWEEQRRLRNPVSSLVRLTETPSRYTEYINGTLASDGRIYYVKWSLHKPHRLVSLDPETGEENYIREFSFNSSRLYTGGDSTRIYWTEYRSDSRWSLREWSDLYCYDIIRKRVRRITSKDRLFNAGISGDGSMVVCSRYGADGRYSLVCLDSGSGKEHSSAAAPEGIRFTESVWDGNRIISLGISDKGMGIYATDCREGILSGKWETVRKPQNCHLSEINVHGEDIIFVSDADGISNLYRMQTDGTEEQICSVRYSGKSYIFGKDGKSVYVSDLGTMGYIPSVCAEPEPAPVPEGTFYPIADSLGVMAAESVGTPLRQNVTDTLREHPYNKATHLFRFHSWAPFYYDVDKVMDMSFDYIQQVASPGITLMSQNSLGTAVSRLGYFYRNGRHGAAGNFTYSGLFPVIEAEIRYNDRGRYRTSIDFASLLPGQKNEELQAGYFSAGLKTYIPFSWNRCGWYSGLIPSFSVNAGNDSYVFRYRSGTEILTDEYRFFGSFSASLRYYVMTATARSAIYPRFGIGAEAGYAGVLTARKWINDIAYAYVYGYLPSFLNHGIRLSVLHSFSTGSKKLYLTGVNLNPRGLGPMNVSEGTLMTLDYAAPVHLGDISIPGILYLKRAVITTFADLLATGGWKDLTTSYGADLKVGFRIFNLPYDIEAGVRLAGNAGRLPQDAGRFSTGFLFSVSFQ